MATGPLYRFVILAISLMCFAGFPALGMTFASDQCDHCNVDGRCRVKTVTWGNKTYKASTFGGGKNDTYALAFYLSVDVAVSAAQARNGCLFDVVKVEGKPEYKQLMAQMQQDLKGNRSEYYAKPYWYLLGPVFDQKAYKTYFRRLWKHLRRPSADARPKVTNPVPIFKEMLATLQAATEASLGAKMNVSRKGWKRDKLVMHIGAPWALNFTYEHGMRGAMAELGMVSRAGEMLQVSPYTDWHNHSNDERNWAGEEGTAIAFEQARAMVEMREHDTTGHHPQFYDNVDWWRDFRRNGFKPPPQPGVLELECVSWRQCLSEFPWRGQTLDEKYWDMYS